MDDVMHIGGYIPSKIDTRDYKYTPYMTAIPKTLPTSFMLPKLPNKKQGDFGACVGFGSSNMKDVQEEFNHPSRGIVTSPAFIYTEAKKIDGIPVEGTDVRSAMKVLLDKGVCLERSCPYNDESMKKGLPTITDAMYTEAKQYKIGSYMQVTSIDEMKHAITENSPVTMGLMVTETFCNPDNGFMIMPEGNILGGHCVCMIGYDDNLEHTYPDGTKHTGFFYLRNSWRDTWGLGNDFAWLPYDFVTGGDYPKFAECWTTKDVIMPNPPAKTVVLWLNSTTAVIDGSTVTLDQEPYLDPGTQRVLLPLRFVSEVFGYKVDWNEEKKQILVTRGNDQLLVTISSQEAILNTRFVVLNQPPIIDPTTNRTLVPVRFFSEVFGYSVSWNATTKQITITA